MACDRSARSRRRALRIASSSTCTSLDRTASVRPERQRSPYRISAALLACETAVDADVVVPVPDSGVCAAMGYAEEAKLPMRFGLIRNHYVGRTFIEPAQSIRHFGVKVKLNPVKSILAGKRVVLVDDSIVRGTTSRKIVKMVRAAGAQRSAHANQLSAHRLAMFLRCRHAAPQRADRGDAFARRNPRLYRRRHPWLSQHGRTDLAVGAEQQHYCTSCYTGSIRWRSRAMRTHISSSRSSSMARSGCPKKNPKALSDSRRAAVAVVVAIPLAGAVVSPLSRSAARRRRSPADLSAAIDQLGDLDYGIRSKRVASIRRAPPAQAVPALLQA